MVDGKTRLQFAEISILDILMRAWVNVSVFLNTSLYMGPIQVVAECDCWGGWQLTWNKQYLRERAISHTLA